MSVEHLPLVELDGLKIEISDFEAQKVSITFSDGFTIRFINFTCYETFAKKIYAAYKKYKYVFEKGEK